MAGTPHMAYRIIKLNKLNIFLLGWTLSLSHLVYDINGMYVFKCAAPGYMRMWDY